MSSKGLGFVLSWLWDGLQQSRMLQLEATVALIEKTVPGVQGGQERGGSGFEESGKGQVPHALKSRAEAVGLL